MSTFLEIGLERVCAKAPCIWSKPDGDGCASCIVCGRPRADKDTPGLTAEQFFDEMSRGPIERGIAR